jgi:hypothetical protein
MAIHHVNRKGDTYYLHEGKTKTGKPKFFFSKKKEGVLADAIPEGYEIYENPNAQVFLRKYSPPLIREEEIAQVEKSLRNLAKLKHFIVEAKQDTIVVHLPDKNIDSLVKTFSPLCGFGINPSSLPNLERFMSYSPMMRFVLVDPEHRLFATQRWCFLGSIDDWIYLSRAEQLATLLAKYAPHLGKESFFELM